MALSEAAQAHIDESIRLECFKLFGDPDTFAGVVASSREHYEEQNNRELLPSVYEQVGVEVVWLPDGSKMFVFSPKSGCSSNSQLIYYHGGGFVLNVDDTNIDMCACMANQLGCRVLLPIYPLIPEATCYEILGCAMNAYQWALESSQGGAIAFMGDSAGANICLAVAMLSRDQGLPQPAFMIPYSPFIDFMASTERATGTHIDDDPLLSWYGLQEAAKMYAGDTDVEAFPADPFFGNKEGLAPMLIFAGTRGILYPGICKFVEDVRAAGGQVEFKPYEGMWHAFLLNSHQGIPECDQAFDESIAALKAYL